MSEIVQMLWLAVCAVIGHWDQSTVWRSPGVTWLEARFCPRCGTVLETRRKR